MKCISVLFAISAIIGLGQAHQFPDFGNGTLHEDIQDFLDLVPTESIKTIVMDYISEDSEVQAAIDYLLTSDVLPNLVSGVEGIPECINLLNYIQKQGTDIYSVLNQLNDALGLDPISPPKAHSSSQRTGGIAGLVKDIVQVIPVEKFVRTYVEKMKNSEALVGLVNELKSDNFQTLVNKVYKIEAFLTIVNGLKSSGVDTQFAADLIYIVLDITVPNGVSVYRTVQDELEDFLALLPVDKMTQIAVDYITKDPKVQEALQYMFTPEFQNLLLGIEGLNEHAALIKFLQAAGLDVVGMINALHKAIGMGDYVPPKIKNMNKSQIGVQKIGDGLTGMIQDLYDILPLDKIDALYEEKMQNSQVFADFIGKLTSPDMQKLIDNLYANETYKNFVMATRAKGLDFHKATEFVTRIFGLEFPY